jgi:molybdopterin-binding protein
MDMELSARNQLKGKVKDITHGAVMAEVIIDVGGTDIVAAITDSSVKRLNLRVGDQVTAIIKATEVIIGK